MVRPAPPQAPHIAVLGGFGLWHGDKPVRIPAGSERVLAFVALRCRAAVPRALVAGELWPDAPDPCAHTNLRAALARLRGAARQALDIRPAELGLAIGASVDLHGGRELAHRILCPKTPLDRLDLDVGTVDDLTADLLPGWYEEWALQHAEEWHQLRVHALEKLAGHFTGRRRGQRRPAPRECPVLPRTRPPRRGQPLRGAGRVRALCPPAAQGAGTAPDGAATTARGLADRWR